MEARLKAILEMESSQMQKELIAASNNLKKFERELASATDTNHITYLQRNIGILNADINRLTASANASAKAMGAVGAATKTAGMNSMNFARVIQDLPFGFMGIQNNLTQLIPGIGAAGLAFSALTAAITFSQVGMQYWSKGTKDAKAAVDELGKVMKDANKDAGEEITKSRLLYEASNNLTLSMDKRIRAAKELKDLYPEQFKNYSAEEIALGKASKGYKDLAASILEAARAKAIEGKISELESKKLDLELQRTKVRNATTNEIGRAKDTRMPFIGGGGFGVNSGETSAVVTKEENINRILVRRAGAYKEIDKELKSINAEQAFYESLVSKEALQSSVIPSADKGTGKTKGKKPFNNANFASKMQAWQNESLAPAPVVKDNTKDTSQKPVKDSLDDPAYWAKLAEAKALNNQQILDLAAFSEYAGQAVGQMVNAMMNGENIGDVLANAFKQIAVQIAAAVAQALIFAALLEAFPALKGVFATVGAVVGNGGGGAGSILGNIKGQDIQLSNARTSTGMGYRRGRNG